MNCQTLRGREFLVKGEDMVQRWSVSPSCSCERKWEKRAHHLALCSCSCSVWMFCVGELLQRFEGESRMPMSCALSHHTLQRYFWDEIRVRSNISELLLLCLPCSYYSVAPNWASHRIAAVEFRSVYNMDKGKMSSIFLKEKILRDL